MSHGYDISENQGSFPGGADFYIIRTVNEYGRQDYKWQQFHIAAAGKPRGAYMIVSTEHVSAGQAADQFAATLTQDPWEIIPWIDIELGAADANLRAYVAEVRDRLLGIGIPTGGYYSDGSAYLQVCYDLFQKQWLAAYPGPLHHRFDIHQYTNTPVDQNDCPDLNAVLWGRPVEDDMTSEEHAWLEQTALRTAQLQQLFVSDSDNKYATVETVVWQALKTPEGQQAIRDAVQGVTPTP